jgi:hypothetical protein
MKTAKFSQYLFLTKNDVIVRWYTLMPVLFYYFILFLTPVEEHVE